MKRRKHKYSGHLPSSGDGKITGPYETMKELGLINISSGVGKDFETLFNMHMIDDSNYVVIEPDYEGGKLMGYIIMSMNNDPNGIKDRIIRKRYIKKDEVEKLQELTLNRIYGFRRPSSQRSR